MCNECSDQQVPFALEFWPSRNALQWIRFDDQTASTIFTIVDDDINNQLNIYYIILLKTKRKKGDLGRSGMNQYFIWLCYAIATTSADWS